MKTASIWTSENLDPNPLPTQRYTKEVKFRQRLNRLLGGLRREDFGGEAGWEEWQEWREDVVWLVVEGGKEDEREAERRLDEWRRDNKDKLDKAAAREREEERKAQLKAEGKDDDDVIDMTDIPNLSARCTHTPACDVVS